MKYKNSNIIIRESGKEKLMKKLVGKVLASTLAVSTILGAVPAFASGTDGATQGTNTFVDGGTDIQFWTFQELHVPFWTSMADEWNKQNPDRPINITVTTGESHALHEKLLTACAAGEGTPDMADIEIGYYGSFLNGGYLIPIDDAVEPYKNDIVYSRVSMYGDGEHVYGADFHLGATVTYYNMDIMNEAGVDPSKIDTWDDFAAAGKTVLEKTGKPMACVEVNDLFLPQAMLLEKGSQYVDEDGNPSIANQDHADVINFIRQMIKDGTIQIAPGGGFHTEEWYGFMNNGGCASITMPLWYMGRFTDYMTDLKGKMAIYPMPVWKSGDVHEVLQGGTGTSVIKGAKDEQLCKDFLAFAKLSKEGCTYEWEKLGFDPIRTELWDDKTITEDPDNKFLQFFTTNPFDILKANGTDITAPNIRGAYSATYSVLVSTTYANAFENSVDEDAMQLLQDEQDTIVY
jgi:arabinosaccharide transport system substrate-binding protein